MGSGERVEGSGEWGVGRMGLEGEGGEGANVNMYKYPPPFLAIITKGFGWSRGHDVELHARGRWFDSISSSPPGCGDVDWTFKKVVLWQRLQQRPKQTTDPRLGSLQQPPNQNKFNKNDNFKSLQKTGA